MSVPNLIDIDEEDVQDFRFRELRKISLGAQGLGPDKKQRLNLICSSNQFGLTFVACKTGVYVFKTSLLYIVDKNESLGKRNVAAPVSSLEPTLIPTPSPPVHISLSSDNLTLSVCLREQDSLNILFHDITALSNKGVYPTPYCSTTVSTEKDANLLDLKWNPNLEFKNLLFIVLSTGLVAVLEVKDRASILVRRDIPLANCVCWSPKGKQIAIGFRNGDIVQYVPKSFEEKRRFPVAPGVSQDGGALVVSDLHWLSPFEFAVTYTPEDQTTLQSFVVLLSTVRNQPVTFHIANDPYSYCIIDSDQRKADKFYYASIHQWDLVITCSNNTIDTVCYGRDKGGHGVTVGAQCSGSWWQWGLDEGGRVEPPLDSQDNETYSAGIAIDYTSQEPVTISETVTLPSCPLFLLMTDHGMLCPYTIINTGCPPEKITELMSPPKPLPSPQQRATVTSSQPLGAPAGTAATSQQQGAFQSLASTGLGSGPGKSSLLAGGQLPFGIKQEAPQATQPPLTAGGPSLLTGGQLPLQLKQGTPQATQPPSMAGGPSSLAGGQLPLGLKQGAHQVTQPPSMTGPGGPSLLAGGQLSLNQGPPTGAQPPYMTGLGGPSSLGGQSSLGFKHPPSLGPGVLSTMQPSSMAGALGSTGISFNRLSSNSPSAGVASVVAPTTTKSFPVKSSLGSQQMPSGHSQNIPGGQKLSAISMQPPQTGKTQFSTAGPTPSAAAPPNVTAKMEPSVIGGPPSVLPSTSTPTKALPSMSATTGLGAKPTASPPQAAGLTAQSTIGTAGKSPIPFAAKSTATIPKPGVPGVGAPTMKSVTPASTPGKQQATKSPSTTAVKEDVENEYARDIQKEIEKFADELDSLQEEQFSLVSPDQDDPAVGLLGKADDMDALNNLVSSLEHKLKKEANNFKKIDTGCDHVKESTLRAFEMYEEARTNTEKKNDPRKASFLKVRPLDSYSTKTLNDLRASFLSISRAIDEVSSQLDAQLEKKYEERRQRGKNLLKAPSIQTIYSTLRDQHRIIRLQSQCMAAIVEDTKKLRLIPQSWRPSENLPSPKKPAPNPQAKQESTPSRRAEGEGTPSRETREGTPGREMQRERMERLRENLHSMKKTPVKKVEKRTRSRYCLRDTSSTPTTHCSSKASSVSGDIPDGGDSVSSEQPCSAQDSQMSFPPVSSESLIVTPQTIPTGAQERPGQSTLPVSGPGPRVSPGTVHHRPPDSSASAPPRAGPQPPYSSQPSPYTTGTGTVHWGSPPEKTEARPKTSITVQLGTCTSVATSNPQTASSLRRTSPHSDLTQIRPQSKAETGFSPLLSSSSASVPNIADIPPHGGLSHLTSGSKDLYGSSPHVVQTGTTAPRTTASPSASKPLEPVTPSGPSALKLPKQTPGSVPATTSTAVNPKEIKPSGLVTTTPFQFPGVSSTGSLFAGISSLAKPPVLPTPSTTKPLSTTVSSAVTTVPSSTLLPLAGSGKQSSFVFGSGTKAPTSGSPSTFTPPTNLVLGGLMNQPFQFGLNATGVSTTTTTVSTSTKPFNFSPALSISSSASMGSRAAPSLSTGAPNIGSTAISKSTLTFPFSSNIFSLSSSSSSQLDTVSLLSTTASSSSTVSTAGVSQFKLTGTPLFGPGSSSQFTPVMSFGKTGDLGKGKAPASTTEPDNEENSASSTTTPDSSGTPQGSQPDFPPTSTEALNNELSPSLKDSITASTPEEVTQSDEQNKGNDQEDAPPSPTNKLDDFKSEGPEPEKPTISAPASASENAGNVADPGTGYAPVKMPDSVSVTGSESSLLTKAVDIILPAKEADVSTIASKEADAKSENTDVIKSTVAGDDIKPVSGVPAVVTVDPGSSANDQEESTPGQDDEDMMGDDTDTVNSGGLMGGFGLGKPQSSNVTTNPFGTPGQVITSPSQQSGGILRSSNLTNPQSSPQPSVIGTGFRLGSSIGTSSGIMGSGIGTSGGIMGSGMGASSGMMGSGMGASSGMMGSGMGASSGMMGPGTGLGGFGQGPGLAFGSGAMFGSPPSLGATNTTGLMNARVFGSGGGGAVGGGIGNQPGNAGQLSFGGIAGGGVGDSSGFASLAKSNSGSSPFSGQSFSGWR